MIKRLGVTFTVTLLSVALYAVEGMWSVFNMPDSIISSMEEAGMDIDASVIYNNGDSCLKNATVYLTSGFTGTIVSESGLLIAPYKSVEKYIPSSIQPGDGFTSPSIYHEVELHNLGAWILKNTVDVTKRVKNETYGLKSEKAITHARDSVSRKIMNGIHVEDGCRAIFTETSTGDYYVNVYQCFNDVRLAYLPPHTIANDTLALERHSADFAVLRIYSDRQNHPSSFDKSNKPFASAYFATVSNNDYSDDNFVFALGYPNKTTRQILSADIEEQYVVKPEAVIFTLAYIDSVGYKDCRDDIKAIEQEVDRMKKSGVLESKKADELSFVTWAASLPDLSQTLRYSNLIPKINDLYSNRQSSVREYQMLNTLLLNVGSLNAASLMLDMNDENEEDVFLKLNDYFVNLDVEKEKSMLNSALDFIKINIDSAAIDQIFAVENSKKYKGNRQKYIDEIFAKSILTDETRFLKYLDKPSEEVMKSDILVSLVMNIDNTRQYFYLLSTENTPDINYYTRLYKEGQSIEKPQIRVTPDANYTLRMSFGRIAGYAPDDLSEVKSTSKLGGMLKSSYLKPKYGMDPVLTDLCNYNDSLKDQNITFLSDLDMATGRMGYGVYDYNGELLGMAVAGNAEAGNSKFLYDLDYQRIVVLDINYILFILENYAQANYLVEEFTFGEKETEVQVMEVEDPSADDGSDVLKIGAEPLETDSGEDPADANVEQQAQNIN